MSAGGLDWDLAEIMGSLINAWDEFMQREEIKQPHVNYSDQEQFRFGIHTCQNVLARIQMSRDNEGWN